jgi:preflagellin peptidase FlaK
MPWVVFFFTVSVLGLAIASYTDLKARMVYNRLSHPLLAIGLLGHLALTIRGASALPFAFSAVAAVGGFAFAFALWKMGVWAGGDVKLFTALAALNPTNPNILGYLGIAIWPATAFIRAPVFPISLFVFSVFAMLPYGILIAVHGLIKKKSERASLVRSASSKAKQTVQLSLAIVGFSWLLSALGLSQWMLVPAVIGLGFLKNKKARAALIGVPFALGFFHEPVRAAAGFAALFVLLFGLYLLVKLHFVSKKVLREKKKVSELQEGDIIAESFIEENGKVKRVQPPEIKRIINYLTSNKLGELKEYLNPSGRVIASGRKARGVTQGEIEELQRLAKEKKIADSVEVKRSAPFVPAMLIAYLALNIVGDLPWAVVF